MRIFIFLLLTIPMASLYGQPMTEKELNDYGTIKSFCEAVQKDGLTNNDLKGKYLFIDYVLADTSNDRIQFRLKILDSAIFLFKRYIDSVGLENLDAKPVRFYKDDKIVFEPFYNELKKSAENIFAYYNKQRPDEPLGYLLFDEKSSKILSWLLVNQGGYHYFFLLNQL